MLIGQFETNLVQVLVDPSSHFFLLFEGEKEV